MKKQKMQKPNAPSVPFCMESKELMESLGLDIVEHRSFVRSYNVYMYIYIYIIWFVLQSLETMYISNAELHLYIGRKFMFLKNQACQVANPRWWAWLSQHFSLCTTMAWMVSGSVKLTKSA